MLDLLRLGSVGTINFLSGCTVLSMSLYSVGKAFLNRDSKVDVATGTLMAIGAAVGGIVGRALNKKMDNRAVDKLFIALMAVIIAICAFNACQAFL